MLPGSFHIGRINKVELIKTISITDHVAIVNFCNENNIDLVYVGPSDALVVGAADALIAANIKCFGPIQAAARIETDKSWSKDFMHKFGILTARYESFNDVTKAKAFIQRLVSSTESNINWYN